MTDQNVLECCKRAVAEERQLLAHCNGDAASEQFLDCYEKAAAECGGQEKDLRPVMIHCQTVREDQIERMSKLLLLHLSEYCSNQTLLLTLDLCSV